MCVSVGHRGQVRRPEEDLRYDSHLLFVGSGLLLLAAVHTRLWWELQGSPFSPSISGEALLLQSCAALGALGSSAVSSYFMASTLHTESCPNPKAWASQWPLWEFVLRGQLSTHSYWLTPFRLTTWPLSPIKRWSPGQVLWPKRELSWQGFEGCCWERQAQSSWMKRPGD